MLINCKECGKEISDTAKHCPHCGAKVTKTKVKKEKVEIGKLFSGLAEKIVKNSKAKLAYFISMIASCAIAVCFLIMTIISFAAPRTFLYSEKWHDFSDLFTELPAYNYKVTIGDDTCYMSCYTYAFTFIIDSSSQVQCYFRDDGSVEAYVIFNGAAGARCEADYEYHGTKAVLVRTWINHYETDLISIEGKMADVMLELTEAAVDYVLLINYRSYDFDDVLRGYANYHDSLNGIRISSLILMAVFTIVSACAVVFYVKFIRKSGQTDESLYEEVDAQAEE